ncbi:MAG: MmgE/PrpD family protein [Deltaproteobacteria bacterium]|nr:MmgE/PrpD family protein [Deltaproteobacteria bacterium]
MKGPLKAEEHAASYEGLGSGGEHILRREQARDVSRRLARFACHLETSKLDPLIVSHSVLIIRDTLGAMLAGSTLPEIGGLAGMAETIGGQGNATIIGRVKGCSPNFAAVVNGAGAVSLELDEGNQFAVNHPAAHIFPAALALAEDLGRSGPELIEAFVAGYELAVRIGRATRLRRAVHPFGTHSIVGTAATAAKLLRLGVEQTAEALDLAAGITIASSQTAANMGASVRNLVTGLANSNGMLAAMAVQAGFKGEAGSMNIVFGEILGTGFVDAGLSDGLGSEFYITRNYFKRHACSRWNHAPIEAISALVAERDFEINDIEEIIVWTYDPATRLSWADPANGYGAKHSIPYNVAARILLGSNSLEVYRDEMLKDPRIRAIMKRVLVREDPEFTAKLPDLRPARVQVKLRSGDILEKTVERPRGGFDNPYTEAELREKFHRLAGMSVRARSVEKLEKMIWELRGIKDIRVLSPLLRGMS